MEYHFTFQKQEGQVALNRSPALYLLKAGHVPGDTWGRATFDPRGIIWTNLVEVH